MDETPPTQALTLREKAEQLFVLGERYEYTSIPCYSSRKKKERPRSGYRPILEIIIATQNRKIYLTNPKYKMNLTERDGSLFLSLQKEGATPEQIEKLDPHFFYLTHAELDNPHSGGNPTVINDVLNSVANLMEYTWRT